MRKINTRRNISMKNFTKTSALTLAITVIAVGTPTASLAATVSIQKNKTNHSIDGLGGAENGRQVHLWGTNNNNKNQRWIETKVDNIYYTYKKEGTNHCLDGGNGGAKGQKVVLWNCNSKNKNQHWEKKSTASGTTRLKKRGFSYSIDGKSGAKNGQTIHLWSSKDSNVNQQWKINTLSGSSSSNNNSSSSGSSSSSGGNSNSSFGLSSNKKPWDNFDLSDWALDTPAKASDGDSERTSDKDFINIKAGKEKFSTKSDDFFYTHSDGGMRFKATVGGAKTSSNTSYVRSELREMLRKGNTSISTTGETKNNWQMGYASTNSKLKAKGGRLHGTLRVNKVTTTGDKSHIGRTIVGQIHASKNEPVRLYYRKLKNNSKGSIYWAHEEKNSDEHYYEIIGSRSSSQKNPSNGIALNELWSYEINQSGSKIEVVIRRGDRNGSIIAKNTIDMKSLKSGYDSKSEWMYFKAGAYTQNNSGNKNDYDLVTFYRLNNSH